MIDWAAGRLRDSKYFKSVERTPGGLLKVTAKGGYSFRVAVLNVCGVVRLPDVEPLFDVAVEPQLVINVPSATSWSGEAIRFVHAAPAAFGTLGDVARAASTEHASFYRNKTMGFFINAMEQHSNVSRVSYVFDRVFTVARKNGRPLTVAVVDAYNMSAEDVRDARSRFGEFDVIVKSSSYGSITSQASEAANSMSAEALKFGELMKRLSK